MGASQFLRAAIVPFFGPMTAFKAFFAAIVPSFGPMTAALGGDAAAGAIMPEEGIPSGGTPFRASRSTPAPPMRSSTALASPSAVLFLWGHPLLLRGAQTLRRASLPLAALTFGEPLWE